MSFRYDVLLYQNISEKTGLSRIFDHRTTRRREISRESQEHLLRLHRVRLRPGSVLHLRPEAEQPRQDLLDLGRVLDVRPGLLLVRSAVPELEVQSRDDDHLVSDATN